MGVSSFIIITYCSIYYTVLFLIENLKKKNLLGVSRIDVSEINKTTLLIFYSIFFYEPFLSGRLRLLFSQHKLRYLSWKMDSYPNHDL